MSRTKPNYIDLLKPKHVRIGIILGVSLYLLYIILDYKLLYSIYREELFLRLFILLPAALGIALSYSKRYYKYIEYAIMGLVISIIGLYVLIVINANINYEVFLLYQFGFLIILLWVGFVFRLRIWYVIMLSILVLFAINFVNYYSEIVYHMMIKTEWKVGVNMLFIASVLVIVLGSYFINNYQKKILKQQKKLECDKAALLIAKNKAEESDRLKSAFLANLSHEIRTPLNAVAGFSALIGDEELSSEERELYSKCIIKNSEDLVTLIEEIIEYSRIEGGEVQIKLKNTAVNMVFEVINTELQKLFSEYDENKIRLIEHKWSDETEVNIDLYKIGQVFKYLLNNAIKFTEQGSIVYGVKNINGNKITFFVKDTGIGISEEKFQLIFESFTQADSFIQQKFGGAGIGLAISKKLVELMGGTISVESELGVGTEFVFTVSVA